MGRDRGGRRRVGAHGLDHRILRDGAPPRDLRHRALVAASRGGRGLRLGEGGVRRFRRIHHRLDLLDVEPPLLSGGSVFRGRQRAVRRRAALDRATRRARRTSSARRSSASPSARPSTSSASRSASGSRTWARSLAGSPPRFWSVIGVVAFVKLGPATSFTARSLIPGTHLKDVIFWSTIAFALTGLESASFLGRRDPRRPPDGPPRDPRRRCRSSRRSTSPAR